MNVLISVLSLSLYINVSQCHENGESEKSAIYIFIYQRLKCIFIYSINNGTELLIDSIDNNKIGLFGTYPNKLRGFKEL